MDFKTRQLLLSILLCLFIVINTGPVSGQRSLLHWKRDLEYRLNSYLNQRDTIRNIVSSSIHSIQEPSLGPRKLFTARNVRFTDLIIPAGALVLDPQVARPTVRILMNKTHGYVNNKMNELYQIRNQLETIKRQVDDPRQPYIYKGLPTRGPQPSVLLNGTWIFKQFMYSHVLSSQSVSVKQINYTDVDHVINETYMANPKFNLYDSQSRLFFEGRKTFWNTMFFGTLKSGCCDRLKPLHTDRMMLKSVNQVVMSPILFQTDGLYGKEPITIDNLDTNQLSNRILVTNPTNQNRFDDLTILPSPPQNLIQLNSLIPINRPFELELQKTIIFKELIVEEANLSASPIAPGNMLLIGFAWNKNMSPFDLSHENYLLKTSPVAQKVPGIVIINAESHFFQPLNALAVNGVPNFRRFALESIVRVDRPATIRGPVLFDALPARFSRPSHSVVMLQVEKGLQVGLVNGMQLPHDIILLPPNPMARPPHQLIVVHGPRRFKNKLTANNLMQVNQLINEMKMPDDVIPLHLNDFMASVGKSNLWFLDGIVANHLTIESGYLDDIHLRDAHTDAQSLIMQSVFSRQPDGSQLIRAPLRVNHLRLLGGPDGNQGLLNGFRPQNLLELRMTPTMDDTIRGKKTFLAPVEAQDCIFGNINNLPNWPNHLIRIDRPGTVQTVHTRLAFGQPSDGPSGGGYTGSSSVSVQDLRVEFNPNSDQQHYVGNWNLSPEFLMLHQALTKESANHTTGRYRIIDQVRLSGRVNNIALNDIVTLDKPFRFADRFVLVGKIEVLGSLEANRVTSNYPLDAMDLVQFDKFRIPILGSLAPIRLSNLVLAGNNQASFVNCRMLNGVSFDEFVNSIMSLTRPQTIDSGLVFNAQVNLEGFSKTGSSVNSIKNFSAFANKLRSARYSFEDGLQCNNVVINSNKFV